MHSKSSGHQLDVTGACTTFLMAHTSIIPAISPN